MRQVICRDRALTNSARSIGRATVAVSLRAFEEVVLLAICLVALSSDGASLVINEIYFDPPDKRPLEFVELYNSSAESVTLTGWALNRYLFPSNMVVKAGTYLVVAVDPPAFAREFGFKPLGPFPGKLKHSGTALTLLDATRQTVDEVHYGVGFPWPTATAGGGSSLERLHPALPVNLPGSWRSSGFPIDGTRRSLVPRFGQRGPAPVPAWQRPTPGARNSVFTEALPPSVLRVAHQPEQPKSGETVTVTAEVKCPLPDLQVKLQMQVIEPGKYIRYSDAAYQQDWLELPMQRGTGSLSNRFTAAVPGEVQKHRRLVRYRVIATALNAAAGLRETAAVRAGALSVQIPYPDDEVPNFAWFVCDGLPLWVGASEPGRTPLWTFSSQMLKTLPVYQLIARLEDVSRSQWDGSYNRQPFFGTLVYDGRVYDHIQFHNRGQASTFLAGKNKWGFKFRRGHSFAAHDDYGRLYANPWNNLDLNACASPWVQMNRGMAGLDEALAFRSFQLAGVPSANTHWLHLRVIDHAAETSSRSQYDGDLWGLYLAVQSMDGPWLDELGLPNGNVYSLQSGRKHLARGMPADGSDWRRFCDGMQGELRESWWRANLNLPAFYSFHALNRLLSNVDLREDANHGFYHAPNGRWAPIPWDNDMMFIPHSHQSGIIYPTRCLEIPTLALEFKNRAREILDLYASDAAPNGGQFAQLVDEYARILCPAGQSRTWPELDMARWNYDPHSNFPGEFYVNPYTRGWSGLPFRRVLDTPDFAGFCRYIVKFCTDSRPRKNYHPDDNNPTGYGWGYLSWEARDDLIPQRPQIQYAGPAGYPLTNLCFTITPFASPRSQAAFAAVQWRVAEIRAPGLVGYQPGQPFGYELQARWQSSELAQATSPFIFPADACKPAHTYRARARYRDSTGRWSHWSEPIQFATEKGE